MKAEVNLANGNMVLKAQDLSVATPGQEQGGDRFFNSTGPGGAFGVHWSAGAGQDVYLIDAGDRVIYVGPSGYHATFTRSTDQKSYQAPAGLNQTLSKNPDGSWKLVAQGSGSVETFNKAGWLASMVNRNGVGEKYLYNTSNQLTSILDPAGRVTKLEYSGRWVSKITDPIGRTKTFTYDNASGLLTTVTDTAGNKTTFGYNPQGQLIAVTSAAGQKVSYSYDAAGKLASATAGTDTLSFAYPTGSQAVVSTPLGEKWTTNFDTLGRVTDTTDPIGGKTTQTWNTNSQSTGGAAAGGGVYSARYDSSNNLTGVTSPSGEKLDYAYGATTDCKITETGNPDLPKCSTDPNGNQTKYAYDSHGNLMSVTNAAGEQTRYIRAVPGSSDTWQQCADKFPGSVCVKIDPMGNWTSYNYDDSGNQTAIYNPDPLDDTFFEYDALGRKTAQVDSDGVRHTYKYDILDHVVEENIAAYGGAPGQQLRFTYDADGKLIYDNTTIRKYDNMGRLTSRAGESVTYNADGRIATQTDDQGKVTSFAYDSRGNVIMVAAPGASCLMDPVSQIGCVKLAYDANNRETKRVLPGNVVQSTSRDNAGRVTEIRAARGDALLTDEQYSYKGNQLDSRIDVAGIGRQAFTVSRYSYDPAGRLTMAYDADPVNSGSPNTAATVWQYQYDHNGNRTTATAARNTGMLDQSTRTATYNGANQITSLKRNNVALPTPTYDPVGNETSAPNPIIQDPTVGPVRTAVTNRAGDTISMSVNGTDQINFRYENTPVGSHSLAWAAGETYRYSHFGLDTTTDDATGARTKFLNTSNGKKLGFTTPAVTAYYLTDRLGSPIAMTDNQGNVQATFTWDPYGGLQNYSGTEAFTDAHHMGFAGGMLDQHTWLTRFGQRWYDPTQGRWTQPDPSGKENNLYLYAGANPCNKKDPSGLLGDCAWDMIGYGLSVAGLAASVIGVVGSVVTIPVTLGSSSIFFYASEVGLVTSFTGRLLSFRSILSDC